MGHIPKACRLVIHGRVQGVYYRASMREEAQRLGVAGQVRNETNGTVTARVEGQAADVDQLIAWARRGPDRARVERVEVEDCPPQGFRDFEVVR